MLDEEEFAIAYKLYVEAGQNGQLLKRMPDFQSLLNYYNELTGFNETVHNAIIHHRISEHGPPCERCGKPYRTPLASFCAACGNKRDLEVFSLKDMFYVLGARYTGYFPQITSLWKELETAYSEPGRHYHTLSHLKHMLSELIIVKDQIKDWDAALFALYYHDVVYKALKSDNEEASANRAIEGMTRLNSSRENMALCKTMILATKKHEPHESSDVNYFTDADLSILGQEWSSYADYAAKVKMEYHKVPGFLYRIKRKKILRNFLAKERIFKTDHFYARYERQARKNIRQELDDLL